MGGVCFQLTAQVDLLQPLPSARFTLHAKACTDKDPCDCCCCLQWALNEDLQAVWNFYDQKKMFNEWAGVLRKLYMSAAALVAGWVS